ncbi:transcriptional regulator FtsR [Streptomyces sp. DT18]
MVDRARGGAGLDGTAAERTRPTGTAAGRTRPVSIGAVLNILREEFPEVTISKIRFLEAEGLIEPQRTPSGYRKFTPRDVERLGHVLRMQRDHYLPLKAIREYLDAVERGERPAAPLVGRQSGPPPRDDVTVSRLGRTELLAAAGVDEAELTAWESYGLVTPLPDGHYDARLVRIARLVSELGRHGIEPRHLRATKAAADREAGLVEQVVAPLVRHRNPQTRAQAEERTRELADLATGLHSALVELALDLRS